MCSTFISLNANALTGPRSYFAMAREGLLPRVLGRVHPRFKTPANAILAQGLWSIVLTLLGTALIMVPPPEIAQAASSPLLSPILSAWAKLNKTPLYDLLLTYVIFGANLFYLLAITSVFVLRVKHADLPRPYRTWGYPWTPLLYVAAALLLLGNMLVDEQSRVQALVGLGLIVLGIPAWAILRRRGSRIANQRPVRPRWPSKAFSIESRSRSGRIASRREVSSETSAGRGSARLASALRLARTSPGPARAALPARCISCTG